MILTYLFCRQLCWRSGATTKVSTSIKYLNLKKIETEHLGFTRNKMEDLPQNMFKSIKSEVVLVDISRNRFTNLPLALRKLTSLVSLYMNNNLATLDEENQFINLTQLMILHLALSDQCEPGTEGVNSQGYPDSVSVNTLSPNQPVRMSCLMEADEMEEPI